MNLYDFFQISHVINYEYFSEYLTTFFKADNNPFPF